MHENEDNGTPARRGRTMRFEDGPAAPPPARPAREDLAPEVDYQKLDARLGELRQKLQESDWNDVDLLVRTGGLCAELGQRDEAVNMLQRALTIDRNNRYARAKLEEVATPEEIREMDLPAAAVNLAGTPTGPFKYPLLGTGPYVLVGGTVFYTLLYYYVALVMRYTPVPVWFIAFVVAFIFMGYLLQYFGRVVNSSATGQKDAPDWPSFDPWVAVLPLKLLLLCLVPMAAAVIFLIFARDFFNSLLVPVLGFLALCELGFIVFPMMMLIFFVRKSFFDAANPVVVLGSIRAAGKQYWTAAGIWMIIAPVGTALTFGLRFLPIIGTLLGAFAMLYFTMVGCRALGLVYQSRQEQLGWY